MSVVIEVQNLKLKLKIGLSELSLSIEDAWELRDRLNGILAALTEDLDDAWELRDRLNGILAALTEDLDVVDFLGIL